MLQPNGIRKHRQGYEVWVRHAGQQHVIGVYENIELARVISWISLWVAGDVGMCEEHDVEAYEIELAEKVGVLDRLREITGWELDSKRARRSREIEQERLIQEKIDWALKLRRDRARAINDHRELKRLQFLTCQDYSYPPIPSLSASATEEAIEIPEQSGIYFVWCPNDQLQYVGQAVNLRNRANLKHERINPGDRVSWLLFPIMELYFAESFYIGIGRPLLNFGGFQDRHKTRALKIGEIPEDTQLELDQK